jgi:glycerol kinase
MTLSPYLLAIDQGTTSSRAIVFDRLGNDCFTAQKEFSQIFPADGWVEHDPEEIWQTTVAVCRESLSAIEQYPVAIGITNQRETIVLWEKATGRTLHNAIVWQDRRTAKQCEVLRNNGHESSIQQKTGLLLDPYFSATKIGWLLDNVEGARIRAQAGELAVGTIDSFLLWRLTGGKVHATDATNASRTLLFNIHSQQWDPELLSLFDIPESLLPDVRDCADDYGYTDPDLLGSAIPICGVAGDQQAALLGQACIQPGMIKSTYGTGCFAIVNTGPDALSSKNRLLTTVAYRLSGQTTYALEGSIFVAGAAIQWLRDGLGVIQSAHESEERAAALTSNRGVYMVPAFTGLGAPYWDPHARGALFGLTRDTGINDLVRSALESVCYQTVDLLEAMVNDNVPAISTLRVDGGMAKNSWQMQFLADILNRPVQRPTTTETSALGAASLAALQAGIIGSLDEFADRWQEDVRFEPDMSDLDRQTLLGQWQRAVHSTRTFGESR